MMTCSAYNENKSTKLRFQSLIPKIKPDEMFPLYGIQSAQHIIYAHRAGTYGIYTILDMHQDILSEKFCGEGIPDWAVDVGSESSTAPFYRHL